MKVSTRGRYGLRAMLELARSFGEAPVLMGTLAETQGVSRKYLHAQLTALKAAGLVRSVRGAGGGFVLSRDPSEIKLSEVLRTLEGSLSLVDCVTDEGTCERTDGCAARKVWQELSSAIDDVLSNVTLGDLIAEEGGRSSGRDPKKKGRPRNRVGSSRSSGRTSPSRRPMAGKR
jgi:Rrf2 family protein